MSAATDPASVAARAVRGAVADATPAGLPGLRLLVRRGLDGALQLPPPTDAHAEVHHPGDPGLCGPGSASWQVLDDIAGLVGGVRALLFQTLHPLAMAGVAQHSAYEKDPFGRLHRTSAWVSTTTFGAVPEALAVTRIVRRMHKRVRGTAPDGRPYAADDPALLAFVSMTFTDALLAADGAYGAHPVSGAHADQFVLEQSRLAALLDPRVPLPSADDEAAIAALSRWELDLPLLDEGLLPRDVAGLTARIDEVRPQLARTPDAVDALRFIAEPGLPLFARPAFQTLLRGAIVTLPADVRALAGHADLRGRRAVRARLRAEVAVATLRLGTGGSPVRRAAEARSLA